MLLLVGCAVADDCAIPLPETSMAYGDEFSTMPQMPMACNPAHVWINGELAPVGTTITFSGTGVLTGCAQCSVKLSQVGGSQWGLTDPKLIIQGIPSPDGHGQFQIAGQSPISFYVNGVPAEVRIYSDAGTYGPSSPDGEWFDTIPWVSGGTYNIDLKVGIETPTPVPTVATTGPCTTWDRDSVRWSDEDMYWIMHWEDDPEEMFLAEAFENLALDWFVPGFRQEQIAEPYQRMVFFANHGGYGCKPNLAAMVEAQGWSIMHTSYGWPYQIGGLDPDHSWTRIVASEAGANRLPSLFCPPIDHPVLTANGYVPSSGEPQTAVYYEEPVPTPKPTAIQTVAPVPTQASTPTSSSTTTNEVNQIPTTIPTPVPPIQTPGTPIVTPVPTTTWSETYIQPVTYKTVFRLPSPSNIAIYYTNLPLPECGSDGKYVPEGFGVLRVSAGSSNGQFYLDDALITNGGVTILKGIPAGNYEVTYRERYYETERVMVPIRQNCVTNVEITPRGPGLLGIIGWPPNWLLDTAPDLSENVEFKFVDLPDRSSPTGSFQILTWWDGTDVFLDGKFFVAGCDIPCDFTFNDLDPGIHQLTYVTGQYESTFPMIIGAGTLTKVGGGAAVQGKDSTGQYIPMNPWDLYGGPE